MSKTLASWQELFQQKRANTPWKDFVQDIGSWFPFMLYKDGTYISRFHPGNTKVGPIVDYKTYSELTEQRSKDIDDRPFFDQFGEVLRHATIAGSKVIGDTINSTYNDIILGAKNAYLNFVVLESENVLYSYAVNGCRNVFSSLQVLNSENIYQSRAVTDSQGVFFSSNIMSSSAVWFSTNMTGCTECLFCDGLDNQSYCINNNQYEKKAYEQMKNHLLTQRDLFDEWNTIVLERGGVNIGESITGSFNRQCDTIENGFMNFQVKEGRNVVFGSGTSTSEHIMDCFSFGGTSADHCYATMGVGWNASHVYGCVEASPNVYNCWYSYLIDSCSYCVGCVGLKNKEYCIFNKQYEKEERFEKVHDLFSRMDEAGVFGTTFPGSINPFYFNDTAASFLDPSFTKEHITAAGYERRDSPISVDIPEGMTTVDARDAESMREIVTETILHDERGNIYRIMPLEKTFLDRWSLPLPTDHRHTRLKQLFSGAKNI